MCMSNAILKAKEDKKLKTTHLLCNMHFCSVFVLFEHAKAGVRARKGDVDLSSPAGTFFPCSQYFALTST